MRACYPPPFFRLIGQSKFFPHHHKFCVFIMKNSKFPPASGKHFSYFTQIDS